MTTTTYVLADAQPIIRIGLRALLETEPVNHVVGDTGDGLEAVRFVDILKPDILISDILLSGLGGLEVARQVRDRNPKTRVLIFSQQSNESFVLEALKYGVYAYVLKDADEKELLHAIGRVISGQRYLSAALSERAMEAYVGKAASLPPDAYDSLTTREREVLQLAAEGIKSSEIGERLSISPRTAEAHRAHLSRKLGLHSQSDLIRFAIRRGLLPIDI